jgi:hypothetical protein
MPGRGMLAPTRAINNINSVKMILSRSSGILKQLTKAENIRIGLLGGFLCGQVWYRENKKA